MPRIFSIHVPNPFKKQPKTSPASLAKFMPPTPGTPATTTPPPKAPSWSVKKSAQKVFGHLFKPTASTKAPVAKAQQGVIQAVTTHQDLVGDDQYLAHLQTMAQDYVAALSASEQESSDDTSDTELDWLQQQIWASKTLPMEPLESALARKEAEVEQALAQLRADMIKTGEPFRTVKLNDGSTVSASFNKDKSVFTVQDSVAYNSKGKFGEWVSVHTQSGSLLLNKVAPADHVSPGPAMRDALLNIELLQTPAPTTA